VCVHELVIVRFRNLGSQETYKLMQGRKGSADWRGRRRAHHNLLFGWRIVLMNARNAITAAALAASLAGALATIARAGPAPAQPGADKCYGVAMAGKNDCAAGAGTSCAGTSTVDYDPGHWKYVAKGTCEGMTTPKGHGSLTAM
jgi:uncharacterized membrane protein